MIRSIGSFLFIAGVLSIILYFVGYNLKILMWIGNWGNTVAWVIRIGVVVLGAVLFIIGKKLDK